jgi:hypothetical protein
MIMFLRKYWLYLLIGFSLVVLVLAILIGNKKPASVTITESVPPNNATDVDIFNPLSITFSAPIDVNLLSITSTPSESWTVTPKNSTTIELSHELAFSPATLYTLTFNYGSAINTLSFTTQKSQGDPRRLQTIRNQMLVDYPLAEQTPYETNLYRVVYRSPLTLEITLKSQAITEQQAIDQIKVWVTAHGGNATSHKYTTILPTN